MNVNTINANYHTLYRLGTRYINTSKLGFQMPDETNMYKIKDEYKNKLIEKLDEIMNNAKPFYLGVLGKYKQDDYLYLYSSDRHAIIIISLENQKVITIFSPYSSPDLTEEMVDEIHSRVNWGKNDFLFIHGMVDTEKLKEAYSQFEDTALKIICQYM